MTRLHILHHGCLGSVSAMRSTPELMRRAANHLVVDVFFRIVFYNARNGASFSGRPGNAVRIYLMVNIICSSSPVFACLSVLALCLGHIPSPSGVMHTNDRIPSRKLSPRGLLCFSASAQSSTVVSILTPCNFQYLRHLPIPDTRQSSTCLPRLLSRYGKSPSPQNTSFETIYS